MLTLAWNENEKHLQLQKIKGCGLPSMTVGTWHINLDYQFEGGSI